MNEFLQKKINEVGLTIPNILFPNKDINLTKFSCIAADQYTQDLSYWEKVKCFIGDSPSTYNLIFPEAELEKLFSEDKIYADSEIFKKVTTINANMDKYISNNIYEDIGKCFIYVKRNIRGKIRQGLLVAIDLEKYDYNKGAKSLIRATELTVKERLTVRKKIRKNAKLDLPHIQVLINDKNNKLFDYIRNIKFEKALYDFDLMFDGGNIKGYKITDENDFEKIADILFELKKESTDGLLYAVGDGNHSLAAAKDVYDNTGRGRFALVELINIYDEGLEFYPIHRLVMGVSKEAFTKVTGIDPKNPPPLQELQNILDSYNYKIDYIHGKKECEELGEKPGFISITYDKFSYETLFDDVIKNGALCRKSFSMGEAKDKRYYLEAQKIL